MIRIVMVAALVGTLVCAAMPSFAEDAIPLVIPPQDVMTTVTTDINKGMAEFNPTEILTPKPIEAAAPAAPAPKVKKKRSANKRLKKMARK